ncbi:MAG: hypothetical protein CSA62_04225 [Planctomycetota bacterium]|nr:MAG: hypothetical protein CSA62_04225 [Planctomycetota bacterium]
MSTLPEEHREFRGESSPDSAAFRERILSLIPEALAGELEPELQELVERQVGRNLELAREWESQRRARSALKRLAEGGAEDPGLDDLFFEELHCGIVQAIRDEEQLGADLRTLDRYRGASTVEAGGEGLFLKLYRAAKGSMQSLPAAALLPSPGARVLRLAPRLAMAAACVFLGLFLGRFLASDSVLVPVSGGLNPLEEGGQGLSLRGHDPSLQADIEKVYAEIKALPAPEKEALLGLGSASSASESESLASAEGGVDL